MTGSVWAKDQAFAPDGQLNEFAPSGTKFLLWDAEIIDPLFETEIGTAPMMHITVSTLKDPKNKLVVSSIGDTNALKFFDKEEKGDSVEYTNKVQKGDFPAVVETTTVPASQDAFSDAFVIRFVDFYTKETASKYTAENDVPF